MKRRDFIQLAGLGAGALMLPLPSYSRSVDPAKLLEPFMDVIKKKQLADIA